MVRKVQGLTGPALAAALSGGSPLAPAADLDGSMFVGEAVGGRFYFDRLIPPPGPGSGRLHLGARAVGRRWPAMPWGGQVLSIT